MFELRQAELAFLEEHPEFGPLFRSGYLRAVFSDDNTIEIIATEAARRRGSRTISLYRRKSII